MLEDFGKKNDIGAKEMVREKLEQYLENEVEIMLQDGDVITGTLYKTGEEVIKQKPDLYMPRNYYVLLNPTSCFFRSSQVRKVREIMPDIPVVRARVKKKRRTPVRNTEE